MSSRLLQVERWRWFHVKNLFSHPRLSPSYCNSPSIWFFPDPFNWNYTLCNSLRSINGRFRLIPASIVGVMAWAHVAISGNDPNAMGSALFSIFIGLWTTWEKYCRVSSCSSLRCFDLRSYTCSYAIERESWWYTCDLIFLPGILNLQYTWFRHPFRLDLHQQRNILTLFDR